MNASELARYIGQTTTLREGGFEVMVEVHDARVTYGHAEVQVGQPGSADRSWVRVSRTTLDDAR